MITCLPSPQTISHFHYGSRPSFSQAIEKPDISDHHLSLPNTPPKPLPTLLDVVNACNNVRVHQISPFASPFDSEKLVPLYLSESLVSPVIGLLRPIMVHQLKLENKRNCEIGAKEMWSIRLDSPQIPRYGRPLGPSVSLQSWLNTHAKRTAAFKELCERWRDTQLFNSVCGPKKWRDEPYPVYANPFGRHDHPSRGALVPEDELNYIFEMERSACPLFGIVGYGVHMSIYKEIKVGEEKTLQVWVPTRSRTKQTFPGFLDNSVAGGIPSGMTAFEALVKECMEEASIEDHIARKYIKGTGAISYFYRTSTGWLKPEIQYTFDMRILPEEQIEPRPYDGEVESFELLSYDVIKDSMHSGLFKPNCALVLIDLFMRLGYVTPDNEPDYMEILTLMHSRFDFEKW